MPRSPDSTAFASVLERRLATPDGAILFDAARIPQASPALVDPDRWPTLGKAGRGTVKAVSGEFGHGVLRAYRRGGLIARLSRERYVWTGEAQTRAFREFRLLARLRTRGLPVPAPLAASYRRRGLSYTATLLTEEIPNATTLAEFWSASLTDINAWRSLGATLATFHRAGVWHADLNAHNLLRDAQGRWWLIDFDRGRERAPDPGWSRSRLARLERSLRKLGASANPAWPDAWSALVTAHDAPDA